MMRTEWVKRIKPFIWRDRTSKMELLKKENLPYVIKLLTSFLSHNKSHSWSIASSYKVKLLCLEKAAIQQAPSNEQRNLAQSKF